jgi:hypothetical protein
MHTEIQVRGSFTAHGIKALTKIAAESVEEFFLGLPVITHVKLVVHSVGRANVRECLIKIRPALTKLGHVPVGVPVAVHTEGGQGPSRGCPTKLPTSS